MSEGLMIGVRVADHRDHQILQKLENRTAAIERVLRCHGSPGANASVTWPRHTRLKLKRTISTADDLYAHPSLSLGATLSQDRALTIGRVINHHISAISRCYTRGQIRQLQAYVS